MWTKNAMPDTREKVEREEWYFSVQDVVAVLSEITDPKQYIKKMRARDPQLSANWGTICTPVQMPAADGNAAGVARKALQAAHWGEAKDCGSKPSAFWKKTMRFR